MTTAAAELLAAAFKLPAEDQQELADRLCEHLLLLDDPIHSLSDDEYEAEMEKLADELGLPPDADMTWEQVRELR